MRFVIIPTVWIPSLKVAAYSALLLVLVTFGLALAAFALALVDMTLIQEIMNRD